MPGGTKGKRTQRVGEPVRLDPDKIVAAALTVADREGLDRTTLRMVGAELGADPTAIYRHFASKDALVTAMADRLFLGLLEIELPRPWRERMRVLLRASREMYVTHPTMVDVLPNRTEESDALRTLNEVLVGCLRDAGVDDVRIGLFHQMLSSYVIGTGVLEASWNRPENSSREASRRWYGALDPDEYPNCVATAPSLFPSGEDVFEFAVDLFIDAVSAAARDARRRSTSTRSATSTTTRTSR